MLLPQLRKNTVKEQIIEILSHDYPLTAKKL